MYDRMRALREARGLTQEALAERAGLSRQQVGAMEARRHVPNVAAALAVAEVLGATVEQLFGDAASTAVPVTGAWVEGAAVRAGRVGEQLVTDRATAPTAAAERWALGDGIATDGGVALFPGAVPASLVVAGCDPLLGSLGEAVEHSGRQRVLVVHASSRDAIEALASGRAHAAVVHGPTGSLTPPDEVAVRRWHVARWQAGLAAAGSTAPTLDELASRRARVVQRDIGAATQAALERALTAAGVGSLPGPVADGHLDVARRVRSRQARAGVTMEAAALAFGLTFAPLEVHDVELWVPERWWHTPPVDALVQALADDGFARRAATVAGYDLAGIGTELREAV
jgi:transcriptional regulator with XRE-family HTH domain/molybdate-binding protein